jgi:Uma2 family endonuclease
MGMPALVPRYTAEEIRHFPDDRLRYEVVRGELFVTPAPGTRHQRAVLALATTLAAYVEAHALGEAIISPFEVEFSDDTAVQPDVLVILADLVVEVISYSSKRTDRLQKRVLYMEDGVEEYWVVDCDQRHIERWRPGSTTPDIVTGDLHWQPRPHVPPCTIALPALFRRVWR